MSNDNNDSSNFQPECHDVQAGKAQGSMFIDPKTGRGFVQFPGNLCILCQAEERYNQNLICKTCSNRDRWLPALKPEGMVPLDGQDLVPGTKVWKSEPDWPDADGNPNMGRVGYVVEKSECRSDVKMPLEDGYSICMMPHLKNDGRNWFGVMSVKGLYYCAQSDKDLRSKPKVSNVDSWPIITSIISRG